MTLELRNVTKSYGVAATPAVDDVSFTVARGELVILVGESGCGKTTTLKMINRLVEPTGGDVLVNGSSVTSRDPVELRRSIGYAFQGVGLFPHLTVAQNIGVVPSLLGWGEERTAARVAELLELVRLDPALAGRHPAALSGGQQQRVGFARALAAGPAVMLLDEPFGALDPITRDDLQREFKQIQTQLELTAVLVTHDMTEALLLGERVIVMRSGRIVREGTPHELLQHPDDEYVARLLATPRRHADAIESLAS